MIPLALRAKGIVAALEILGVQDFQSFVAKANELGQRWLKGYGFARGLSLR